VHSVEIQLVPAGRRLLAGDRGNQPKTERAPTYKSARIKSSTNVLLGGDGGVGGNLKVEKLKGAEVGVKGGTWTCISPSQIGEFWHGETSVGDPPSEADVAARVSDVVARAASPVRMVRAPSPWSMLRRRSNATGWVRGSARRELRSVCPWTLSGLTHRCGCAAP
jgi:hypothetical protein